MIRFVNSSRKSSIFPRSNHILDQYADRESQRVTLRQLIVFGRSLTDDKLLKSANYVRTELPVRLAHRIRDFQNLPFIVGTNPHIEKMYSMYWEAFELFRNIPPITSLEQNTEFCQFIEKMLDKHKIAIPQLALGIAETSVHMESPHETDRFMNEMLRSRIGRRVLAEQHVALTKAFHRHPRAIRSSIVGIVDHDCHAATLVEKCHAVVQELFQQVYRTDCPEIHIDGALNATFTYIPDHLEYILFELLKNSIYHSLATHAPQLLNASTKPNASEHQKRLLDNVPPIRLTISQTKDQVVFRISDQGGGIPKDTIDNLWSFSHISKQNLLNFRKMPQMTAKLDDKVSPALHLGVGLCLARAFANYWGGSIHVQSMQGYGTDVYVKISTENTEESLKYYRSTCDEDDA